MNVHACCDAANRDRIQTPRSASRWQRRARVAGWIIPGVTMVLLPKCPMCVAMCVALFTGVGISMTTASYIRTGLPSLCTTALLGLTLKALRDSFSRRSRGD